MPNSSFASTATNRPKGARNERALTPQGQKTVRTLTVEAQEMIVQYQADWMPDMGHFEFSSPHEPPRRIPVSETGYRSHFAPMEDVVASSSPQDYARDFVLSQIRSRHLECENQTAISFRCSDPQISPAGADRQGISVVWCSLYYAGKIAHCVQGWPVSRGAIHDAR